MTAGRLRSAWVEVDLSALRGNLALLAHERPPGVDWLFVVKDDAYGHGMGPAVDVALVAGVSGFAVAHVDEGVRLRERGLRSPILVLNEPFPGDLDEYLWHDLTVCTGTPEVIKATSRLATRAGRAARLEVEIDTGLSRYGVRWDRCGPVLDVLDAARGVELSGVFSHFVMSDETDKTFAFTQLERYQGCLREFSARGHRGFRAHLCNSGGFLDIPDAHFGLVRLGILPWGVYPSRVCRRIAGLREVMAVKTRVACCRSIEEGDTVGYGLAYRAPWPMRVATLPLGYGDGFPRVCNAGRVLIRGRPAPIVGRVAMDSMMVDVTGIPGVEREDEVVLMGRQGDEAIDARELADLKRSTTYDILCGWRHRLPKVDLAGGPQGERSDG